MKKRIFILIALILWSTFSLPALAAAEAKIDEQLEINRNALLAGPDELIRTKAASLMLGSENPAARAVLLEILTKTENAEACTAICKAIAESNGEREIPAKEAFIEPLITILVSDGGSELAKIAARALLVFDFREVDKPLLLKISDESVNEQGRLNVVNALRLQPDINAIVRLIELLDIADEQIAAAAGEALTSFGIPAVGADSATRRKIIADLKRLGKEEFVKIWQMRQEYERRLEQLSRERQMWRSKSLGLLEELYGKIGVDEAGKIGFLSKYLGSTEAEERLWALSKVSQWWVGTESKTKVLDELGPALIKLIADDNRQVRLNTAKLLSLMGELNSAGTLLGQLKVEKDDAVRTEQFIALGQACRYAFSPQSPFKLAPEVRKETLDLAVEYLSSEDGKKARNGANVIQNILENNGLEKAEADFYLQGLASRYKQAESDGALRGELLNSMSMLCGRGVYQQRAVELYERLFVTSLNDEQDLVREAAVNGLINISKTQALVKLREDFPKDSNVNIRKKLIALAEEVGTSEDLAWLYEKLKSDSEGSAAWKVMLKIFEGADIELLSQWTGQIGTVEPVRQIGFYEILEAKARAADNPELVKNVQKQLAGLYAESGDFHQARKYLADVIKQEADPQEKERLTAELLQLFLKNRQTDAVKSLVENQLMERDIGSDSSLGQVLLDYVKAESGDSQALIGELGEIKPAKSADRPKWQELLKDLSQTISKPAEPNNLATVDSSPDSAATP